MKRFILSLLVVLGLTSCSMAPSTRTTWGVHYNLTSSKVIHFRLSNVKFSENGMILGTYSEYGEVLLNLKNCFLYSRETCYVCQFHGR